MQQSLFRTKKCYVCNRDFGRSQAYVEVGDLFRCKVCAPGTARWLKSDVGKRSQFFAAFSKEAEKGQKWI